MQGTARPPIRLREGQDGDLDRVFRRQVEVYTEELGWAPSFVPYLEATLAPLREDADAGARLWVAEMEGRVVGFVGVHGARERTGWARLRWLFVEREARGRGLGARLVRRVLAFAREAGCEGVLLTTVTDLLAARRLYEQAGFTLEEERPCAWAPREREQTWVLPFRRPPPR